MKGNLTPLRWAGGKSHVAEEIFEMFPPGPVDSYIEPFVGGGSLFFLAYKRNYAKCYWINDKYEPLVNFYRQLAHDFRNLLSFVEVALASKESYGEKFSDYVKGLKKMTFDNPTVMASTFFVINRCSFSGSQDSGGIGKHTTRFTKSAVDKLLPASQVLSDPGVAITCWDAVEMLEDFKAEARKRPEKEVFVFLDPPYTTAKKLYGKNGNLHDFDHAKLAESLKTLPPNCKFLLTYGDCDKIRELYSWAEVQEVTFRYSMSRKKQGKELIIRNYK